MPSWKPGDRVKIVRREVRGDDHLTGCYYAHMANLTGTVTSVYGQDEVAVKIDPESFTQTMAEAHKEAVRRMRIKFLDSLSDEQKRKLTAEEKRFEANYVVLVKAKDLVKGPKPSPKPKPNETEDEENYDFTSVRDDVIYDDQSVPDPATPKRKTKAELEAAEREELRRRRN